MELSPRRFGVIILAMLAVLAAAISMIVGLPGKASAVGQASQCWTGFHNPNYNHPARTLAVGEAMFTCLDGYIAGGIPNLNERIEGMQIEAELQSRDASGEWVTRDVGSAEADRAETIRVPLQAPCFGSTSTLWRVMISYAAAQEHNPGSEWWVKDEFEQYGVAGRLAELDCG